MVQVGESKKECKKDNFKNMTKKMCECVITELLLSSSEYNDWHGLVLFSLMESNLSFF